MNTLVKSLDLVRRAHRMSVRDMAHRLHVSNSYSAMLLAGQRELGIKALRGIAREFPELHPEILEYLTASDNGHQDNDA